MAGPKDSDHGNRSRSRNLPHRNRQHILRPIAQPAALVRSRSEVKPDAPMSHLHTQHVSSRLVKPFPFFKLPGEIRNKVYSLLIPHSRVQVAGNHPQKELQMLRSSHPHRRHKAPRNRLYCASSSKPLATALLLTCHQMNQEVVQFVYTRTTFCFDRIVTLRKFLHITPAAGQRRIENLEIKHIGYGEPEWMKDRVWKLRHDAKWEMVLQLIKQQVTSLRGLKLDLMFFDWPCRLETNERWARPLMRLAGDGLDRVSVVLTHDRFHPVKMAATAADLENKMMSAQGRKNKVREERARLAMEKKRKEDARRKATKSLAIRLPLNQGISSTNMPTKKVVKRKRLESFAVAQPPVAFC